MTASPLTLDELARHAEVEAQVLRAVSPLGIEQASQLLLALVGKIRGDRRPIQHLDCAPTDPNRQSPDPREAPLLREPDDGLNDLRERLAAPDKRRTRVKSAALPEPQDVEPRKYTFSESKPVEVDDEPVEEPAAARPLVSQGRNGRSQIVRDLIAKMGPVNEEEIFPLVAKAMGEAGEPKRSKNRTKAIIWNLVCMTKVVDEDRLEDGSRILRLSPKGRRET